MYKLSYDVYEIPNRIHIKAVVALKASLKRCISIKELFFAWTAIASVLLVKLCDMLYSSNFVRLFHRQSFTLYGILT